MIESNKKLKAAYGHSPTFIKIKDAKIKVSSNQVQNMNQSTINLKTNRGATVHCILWSCDSPRGVVITAAGAGGGPGPGGSDGPYCLFQRLATNLPKQHGITVIQIIYHEFSDFQVAVDDILAAIDYTKGILSVSVGIVLLGWSMGGAAVVEAAYQRGKQVKGIITIGGQTVGGENANKLDSETAFAILHGSNDNCISPAAANHFYSLAGGASKRNLILKMFPGEDHGIQGAWDFLVVRKDAYLRNLFCISEESWHLLECVEGDNTNTKTFQPSTSKKEFYILFDRQLITVPCYRELNDIKVADVKEWFSEKVGIPSDNLVYIFNGNVMENNLTLEEARVDFCSTIRVQYST